MYDFKKSIKKIIYLSYILHMINKIGKKINYKTSYYINIIIFLLISIILIIYQFKLIYKDCDQLNYIRAL